MSRLVGRDDAGFRFFLSPTPWRTADGRALSWLRTQPFSTVPLLCWWCGFEIEDVDEVKSGIAELEPLEACPQVDDVALDAARWIEAVEDVLVELDGEGAA